MELRRRGFLGALIGVAVVPRLILSAMAEPVKLAALAPLQALPLIESEIILPAGSIHQIYLRGTADAAKAGMFALHRVDGQCVIRLPFNVYGGMLAWDAAATNQIIATESHPLLIASDADIEGTISFTGKAGMQHAMVRGGQITGIIPANRNWAIDAAR